MRNATIQTVSSMNSTQAAAKRTTVAERIERNTAALEALQNATKIEVGQTVLVKQGRRSPNNPETDTYKEVSMTVIDTAVVDGKQLFKVREGEGFTAKEHIIDRTKLVLDMPEGVGKLSEEQLLNRLESDRKYYAELTARVDAALAEENRPMPFTASVKLGRAETAREVECTVLARHVSAKGESSYAVVAEDALIVVGLNSLRFFADEVTAGAPSEA